MNTRVALRLMPVLPEDHAFSVVLQCSTGKDAMCVSCQAHRHRRQSQGASSEPVHTQTGGCTTIHLLECIPRVCIEASRFQKCNHLTPMESSAPSLPPSFKQYTTNTISSQHNDLEDGDDAPQSQSVSSTVDIYTLYRDMSTYFGNYGFFSKSSLESFTMEVIDPIRTG